MGTAGTYLPCQPPPSPPYCPGRAGWLCPKAHSTVLHRGLRGQAGQENRSPVGPRAVPSRTPQRWPWLKPGRNLPAEGAQSISLFLPQVHSLLPSCPHSRLLALTGVIMPRGQKSKRRAHKKRHQSRQETQSLKGAQATEAAEREESPSCPASVSRGTSPCSPVARSLREPQGAPATSSRDAGVSYPGSEEGAQSQDEKSASTSQAAPSTHSSCRDPLSRKVGMLMQFLLEKYKTKGPIQQAAMLKLFSKKYKKHFPEILKRTSDRMELVFGLELKEVDPSNHCYILVSKLPLPSEGSLSDETGLPTSGLLMILLGTIFTKGNRATEEEIWEFLNALGLYAGRRHLIFGEPRRLISKDFVQQKYLTYRQVPNSDPPRYEFRWGPRAHAETSKMKVLEFVAKITGSVPSAFPELYEEALKDEEERARVRAAARAAAVAEGSALPGRRRAATPTSREGGGGQFVHCVVEESSQAPK
ncbi:LOW QUALITY PROTEIN: melanoma-associated antigen B4-like [Kogia breviceps]|uniref:LOW QUALITY PROTEIN: melanoma-associated antigen B4-like n=1 Tax=Kogia breviceps TaxID=27615 RepID=UPI0027955B4F|nr:LOW QUALITY PROTEIN: melanoma-associated antigen B4-like [Kogia breviceps]